MSYCKVLLVIRRSQYKRNTTITQLSSLPLLRAGKKQGALW